MGGPNLAPDIEGLEIVELEVDGSDPRWQRIVPKKYVYCNPNARTSDFPNRPGKRMVTVALLPPNYFASDPSNHKIMDEIARRRLTRPDRAITETLLDAKKGELVEKPIAGVCGVVQSDAGCGCVVGYVDEGASGRRLSLVDLQDRCRRYYRFAAVVSEEMR